MVFGLAIIPLQRGRQLCRPHDKGTRNYTAESKADKIKELMAILKRNWLWSKGQGVTEGHKVECLGLDQKSVAFRATFLVAL